MRRTGTSTRRTSRTREPGRSTLGESERRGEIRELHKVSRFLDKWRSVFNQRRAAEAGEAARTYIKDLTYRILIVKNYMEWLNDKVLHEIENCGIMSSDDDLMHVNLESDSDSEFYSIDDDTNMKVRRPIADTGAVATTCPWVYGSTMPTVNAGTKKLVGAFGQEAEHSGRRTINAKVRSNRGKKITLSTAYEVTNVRRPVNSISKGNDNGKSFWFTPNQGCGFAKAEKCSDRLEG